jgi:hypothetical protein
MVIVVRDHTQGHTHTHSRTRWTLLNGESARRTYTTQVIHKRQTSMHPAGFEPAIPTRERPQPYDLDRAAAAIGEIKR